MSNRLENAAELAARMPERWRAQQPESPVPFARGMIAARLAASHGEIAAPAGDAHIISLIERGEERHRLWHDGHPTLDGVLRVGSVNIVPAGVRPRALVNDRLVVTHVYLPSASLQLFGQENFEWFSQIDLVDPCHVCDPAVAPILQAISEVVRTPDYYPALMRDGLQLALQTALLRRYSNVTFARGLGEVTRKKSSVIRDWRLRRAVEYLEARIGQEVSLAEVAIVVGLTHRTSLTYLTPPSASHRTDGSCADGLNGPATCLPIHVSLSLTSLIAVVSLLRNISRPFFGSVLG